MGKNVRVYIVKVFEGNLNDFFFFKEEDKW